MPRPDPCDEIHASHENCVGCFYHKRGDRRDVCDCEAPEVSDCPVLVAQPQEAV